MTNPQHLRSMSGHSISSPSATQKQQDIVDQLVQFGYTKSDISQAMGRSVNPLDINEVIEHIKQPNAPYTVCTDYNPFFLIITCIRRYCCNAQTVVKLIHSHGEILYICDLDIFLFPPHVQSEWNELLQSMEALSKPQQLRILQKLKKISNQMVSEKYRNCRFDD